MSIRTLLAAVLVAGSIASPVLASDGTMNTAAANSQIAFFQGGQPERLVEGRNSDRIVVDASKARAAASQGFAPIDLEASSRGVNN
jgi:hypothetical protein